MEDGTTITETDFAMPFEALRFAHVSHLLLDHPLRQIGSLPTTARSVVVDASLTALERLTISCVEQEVDFLLLSGNTFCDADRSLRARVALRTSFGRLREEGIQVFVIPGVHDPAPAWQAIPDLPENVTIFNPDVDEPTAIMRDGHVIATIHGSHYDRQVMGQLQAGEDQEAQRSRPFKIGVFPAEQGGNMDVDAVDDLLDAQNVDYLALAPPFPRLTRTRTRRVAHCPGMAVSYSESETGLQGASFIHVDDHGQLKCQHLTTSPLRRETIRLKVSEATTWDELIRAMRHVVSELDSLQATKVLCVTWEIHGEGGIFDSLHTESDSRSELFQLFGEDATFGTLIVDHKIDTVVAAAELSDEELDEHPIAGGLIRRIDQAESLSAAVVSAKSQGQRSPAFVERLRQIASRTDEEQIRTHAKRIALGSFANIDD